MSLPDHDEPGVNSKRLLHILETTGLKCMNLLRSFYFEKTPVKEITRELGYRNEHSATVQKYKCLEKIRETVKSNSISYEDFLD
jgi:hypothetical protein